MTHDILVPQAGESVTEAMIGSWLKADGSFVQEDEPILDLETDKTNLELAAEISGTLKILVQEGETVQIGQKIGEIIAGAPMEEAPKSTDTAMPSSAAPSAGPLTTPGAKKLIVSENLDPSGIAGSGRGGVVGVQDVRKHVLKDEIKPASAAPEKASVPKADPAPPAPEPLVQGAALSRQVEVKPMSMMRRRIAQRLVESQQTAAILTTFNEIDMSEVMALRSRVKDDFEKKFGVRLGFMSFFIKACVEALQHVPEINAQIRDHQLIYHRYCDIGVAVGTDKGLAVPIIHNAETLTFAEVEAAIAHYAVKVREGRIDLKDLEGGTFTISNGGVYGSLLATPIINPPQSGILGMHKIEKRPVVVNDQIVIRPMMYVALSYDHRIVDGKGAVEFLIKVKECLEDPARLLLHL